MIRLENVLKRSLQDVFKTSWISLEDVLKTSWKRLEDVLKTSWRRFEDVLKTSWRRLEDVWPRRIYWSWPRRFEDVLETSSEDVWLTRICSSWSRRLEDVLQTSSEDEDERRLHQDECLGGHDFWFLTTRLFYKQHFYKQGQDGIGKILSKS